MPYITGWEFVLINEDLLKIESPSDLKWQQKKIKQTCFQQIICLCFRGALIWECLSLKQCFWTKQQLIKWTFHPWIHAFWFVPMFWPWLDLLLINFSYINTCCSPKLELWAIVIVATYSQSGSQRATEVIQLVQATELLHSRVKSKTHTSNLLNQSLSHYVKPSRETKDELIADPNLEELKI